MIDFSDKTTADIKAYAETRGVVLEESNKTRMINELQNALIGIEEQ